jgi:hypothetical protein
MSLRLTTTGVLAVRRDTYDGHEWMDLGTLSGAEDVCHAHIAALAAQKGNNNAE